MPQSLPLVFQLIILWVQQSSSRSLLFAEVNLIGVQCDPRLLCRQQCWRFINVISWWVYSLSSSVNSSETCRGCCCCLTDTPIQYAPLCMCFGVYGSPWNDLSSSLGGNFCFGLFWFSSPRYVAPPRSNDEELALIPGATQHVACGLISSCPHSQARLDHP